MADTSHVGPYLAKMQELGSQPIESVVAYGGLQEAANLAWDTWQLSINMPALQESDRADTEFAPQYHCRFTYYTE